MGIFVIFTMKTKHTVWALGLNTIPIDKLQQKK